jgi:poly(A) polymerase
MEEPATDQAIRRHREHLTRISPERVGDELRLMLTPVTRVSAWPLLRRFGLLPVIFRFVEPRAPDAAGADVVFLETMLGQVVPFGLALAAGAVAYLLPGDVRALVARGSVERIVVGLRRSLKISNEESDSLHGTLAGVGILLQDQFPAVAVLKRFLARPTSRQTRELARALATAGVFAERIKQVDERLTQLERSEYAPPPLLTGDDLVARGLTPGPAFKRALDFVYDEQLEGRVNAREEALELGERKVREFEAKKPAR